MYPDNQDKALHHLHARLRRHAPAEESKANAIDLSGLRSILCVHASWKRRLNAHACFILLTMLTM